MRRFFWNKKAQIGQSGWIKDADAKHIHTVLRMKQGDFLVIFDGEGNDFEAKIVSTSPNEVRVEVIKNIESVDKAPVNITLAQAMLKGKKMDMLARQVTELGIKRWIPFQSERSIPTPIKKKLAAKQTRWKTIVIESMKQCRRSNMTDVHKVVSFNDMLNLGQRDDIKLIFWEDAHLPLSEALKNSPAEPQNITAILGPEGGFTESEVEAAENLGFQSVSLGKRILKAETATVTVCALMQYSFGDLGSPDS